jgi:glyoxylase-like metal-dependent hydrolase (beta-lactamase superfamily II)
VVARSVNRAYLSNTYLLADGAGGTAVVVDTGGPPEPILEAISRLELAPTHVLCTHRHADHTSGNDLYRERFGAKVCSLREESAAIGGVDLELRDGEVLDAGGLRICALHVPGHTPGHAAYVVNEERVFTGDTLFRGSVGGTRASGRAGFGALKNSVMEVLMRLPHGMEVYPGHAGATTIGAEWERNPFIALWRGIGNPGDGRCAVSGEDARLVLEAVDYDGGTKCWVRFDAGNRDEIVPGSIVTRS